MLRSSLIQLKSYSKIANPTWLSDKGGLNAKIEMEDTDVFKANQLKTYKGDTNERKNFSNHFKHDAGGDCP